MDAQLQFVFLLMSLLGCITFSSRAENIEITTLDARSNQNMTLLLRYWEPEHTYFKSNQFQPRGYYLLPSVTALEVRMYNHGRSVWLTIPALQVYAHADRNKEDLSLVPRGVPEQTLHALRQQISLQMEPSFLDLLQSLRAKQPQSSLQVVESYDKFYGPKTGSYPLASTSNADIAQILNRAAKTAFEQEQPVRITLEIPEDEEGMERSQWVGIQPLSFSIGNIVVKHRKKSVLVPFPSTFRSSPLPEGKDLKFYDVYQALDSELIPLMERTGSLEPLRNLPQSAWRRDLLDRTYDAYTEAPPGNAGCSQYLSRLRHIPSVPSTSLEYFFDETVSAKMGFLVTEITP